MAISQKISKIDPSFFYGRQYRPYRKLGSLIPLSAWGDILVSNEKYVQTTMFDFGIKSQLLSTEQTVISPPVLSTARVWRSESVDHNRHLLC